MAKIPRIFQKLFGSTGSNGDFGKFGSLSAGSPSFTKDPTEIQSLDAFLKGWGQAVIADNRPALEDMNSLFLVAFQQVAYILQQGIAEWNTDTIYYANSYVQVDGQIYYSLTNDNQGNNPSTNPSHWSVGIGSQNASREVGEVADFAFSTPPAGWLVCDGSAVSRSTYSNLFAKIGTTWGVGNGSTTFNLPPKGISRIGYDASQTEFNAIGKTGGSKTHSLTANENGPHTHVFKMKTSSAGSGRPVLNGQGADINTELTESSGLGDPHNNLSPYGVFLTCIKY